MSSRLSVVLPVLDESRFLEGTLRALLAQSLPPGEYEVLVVDGGSRDGTPAIAERLALEHPHVIRVLHNPARVSSAGRNVGWRASRSPFVLFLDGHVVLDSPDLLRASLERFEQGAAALARPQPLDPPGLTPFQRSVAAARASLLGHQGRSEIFGSREGEVDPSSSGAAYRRDLLERLGGYDERFDACEDVEFNERVKACGLRAWSSPRFTVRYHPRSSLGDLWRQCARYGRGRARLWRKHPRTLGLTVPLPALFFSLGALLAALGVWIPKLRSAGVLYWGAYVLILATFSLLIIARTASPLSRRSLPAIFVVIHLGFAFGFLSELLHPRARFG